MDIYQETYEKINTAISKHDRKNDDADLDMYADDFDQKEKNVLGQNKPDGGKSEKDEEDEQKEVRWEFKWKQEDDDISGPHSTAQMQKWSEEGYFKTGVWVRKHGEDSQFYTSNRIDFELYM